MIKWAYALPCAVLASLPQIAAAEETGLPKHGSTIALQPTPQGYEGRIDIPPGSGIAELDLTSKDPRLKGVLESTVEKTRSESAPQVKAVTVRLKGGALRHGSYGATLVAKGEVEVTKDGKPTKEKFEVEHDIWLNVPPVTLDSPQTLMIVDEWFGAGVRTTQPQLWEATRHGWLTGITLKQKGDTEPVTEPAGRLLATGSIANIPPGGDGRIELKKHYKLEGRYPLGTSKGKLVVEADQLAVPLTIDFEIRSYIARWVLLVVLLFGVAMGWVVRIWLRGKAELNQERQPTFALLSAIDGALERNRDSTFQTAVASVREKAETALAADKADLVKKQTADARKEFEDALGALLNRRAELDQWIADLLVQLRARWRLPSALVDALAKAKTKLERGLTGLATNDVRSATEELSFELQGLNNAARAAVEDCKRTLGALDALLDALAPLLRPDLDAYRNTLTKPPSAPAQVLPNATAKALLDSLQAMLEYVHASGAYVEASLKGTRALLERQCAAWDSGFAGARLPNRKAWDDWSSRLAGLTSSMGARAEVPGDDLTELPPSARSLVDDLGGVLLEQLPEADRAQIKTLVDARSYPQACGEVSRLTRAERRRGAGLESRSADEGERGEIRDMPVAARGITSLFLTAGAALPTLAYGATPRPHDDAASLAVRSAVSRRNLEATGLLLSLIYGFIIAAGGYFLFADKWIGTPLDFAAAFFWAFATDVGADAATTAARGVKVA